jgi:hypothetical protein
LTVSHDLPFRHSRFEGFRLDDLSLEILLKATRVTSGLAQRAPTEEFLKLCDPFAIAATTPAPLSQRLWQPLIRASCDQRHADARLTR